MNLGKLKKEVTARFTFEASHFLPSYNGKCKNVHGHSYKLEVTVSGSIHYTKFQEGMVIDFHILKKLVDEKVIQTHDHANLNTLYSVPTAENMAVKIFDIIHKAMKKTPGFANCKLEKVTLWETENNYATVKRE